MREVQGVFRAVVLTAFQDLPRISIPDPSLSSTKEVMRMTSI